jgi:hypothetical protein
MARVIWEAKRAVAGRETFMASRRSASGGVFFFHHHADICQRGSMMHARVAGTAA